MSNMTRLWCCVAVICLHGVLVAMKVAPPSPHSEVPSPTGSETHMELPSPMSSESQTESPSPMSSDESKTDEKQGACLSAMTVVLNKLIVAQSGESAIEIRSLATNRLEKTIETPSPVRQLISFSTKRKRVLTFSQRFVAALCCDASIRIIDLTNGASNSLIDETAALSLASLSDGSIVMGGDVFCSLQKDLTGPWSALWLPPCLHTPIYSMVGLSDNQLAIGSACGNIFIIECTDRANCALLEQRFHKINIQDDSHDIRNVIALAVFPDGRLACELDDGCIKVVTINAMVQLPTKKGERVKLIQYRSSVKTLGNPHAGRCVMAITNDGRLVTAVSGSVKIWE